MPMSSGGHVASSSECATKPKVREIGLTGYAVPTRRSLLIGHYVMATAEHREPCVSRGSCTVLGAPSGETPPGDSSNGLSRGPRRICDPWTIRRLCPLGAFALAIWPVAATTRRCHISAMHPCGGIAYGRTHHFSQH